MFDVTPRKSTKVSRCAAFVIVLWLACHINAWAQLQPTLQFFQFATAQQSAQLLSTDDDYVKTTGSLEKQVKLRSTRSVTTAEFLAHMGSTAKDWTAQEQALLMPHLLALESFASRLAWSLPERIVLIRASSRLEDNLPHTRVNAIVLPDAVFQNFPIPLQHLLTHELFHVLTRAHPVLRDKAYAMFGFEPCTKVSVDPAVSQLRITNPDAPLSEHSITLDHQGKQVHALPYIMFPGHGIRPQEGFVQQLLVFWLL
jgi:hypothetical protein